MADNKKNEATVSEAPVATQEVPRGDRGTVGQPTPSLTLKQNWYEEYFVLMNVGNHQNPRKQKWVRKQGAPSLKVYARQQVANGETIAKDWFQCKAGVLNAERSDKNKTRISLEKSATKTAKKGKKTSTKS